MAPSGVLRTVWVKGMKTGELAGLTDPTVPSVPIRPKRLGA